MHANMYLSAFLTEAFIGLEKMRQRAVNMLKTFSITWRALESWQLKIWCFFLGFLGKGLINLQQQEDFVTKQKIRERLAGAGTWSRWNEKPPPVEVYVYECEAVSRITCCQNYWTKKAFVVVVQSA